MGLPPTHKKKKKTQTRGSLSRGRPPTLVKSVKSISRKETRGLINAHHTLHKRRQQALAQEDDQEVAAIDAEIEALGGIEEYQRASLQGQRNDRGGDSSKLLLDWLRTAHGQLRKAPDGQRTRMLEVGALSTQNVCSSSGLFEMVHIDLNSQQPGIEQQDFMERPLPRSDAERFDIISLSLVLNYVPNADMRGQMLLRTLQFLREPQIVLSGDAQNLFPSLFLVLPKSCISNSRYCTEERLDSLMEILGYDKLATKLTNKLAYSLWRRARLCQKPLPLIPKKEVNPGRDRNNFAVVLKPTPSTKITTPKG